MLRPHHRHYVAGFLIDCAVMMALVAMPFFIYRHLGGGAALSGMIGGAQALGYGFLCLLVSSGRLPWAARGLCPAALGVGIFGTAFLAATFTRQPWLYGVLTTVAMAAQAFVWPALHAWIGAEPNLRRRNRRMSRFNASWSLGFTVGPLVSGPLFALDYRLPFVVSFFLCIVTVLILLAAPDERKYFGEPVAGGAEIQSHDRASEVHLYSAWVANVIGSGLAQVTRTVFPKRIDDLVAAGELRLFFEETPSAWLAERAATNYMWLAFAIAAANALTFVVMGRTRGWHHRFSFLVALQAGAAAAYWVLGHTRSIVVMLVCFAVIGIAWGGGFFAAVYYSMADPALKHRRAAVNEGAVGLGGFIGSLSFGYVAEHFGHSLAYHYTPVFVGLALLVQFGLLRYSAQRLRHSGEEGLGARV
jgi:MFS family permease